ncbi:MAG: hypothetical protein AD742_12080 [Methylibium sp. NZG]|nr:MAG: hypothetical protein AD742_12080 [Methylibium sp. NZG]
MGPLDTLWHLLNFFAPALGVGLLAPAMAKLLWRRRLKPVAWLSLSLWTTAAAAAALLGGLVAFGRDGRMETYALLVLGSGAALWWAGFGRAR